MDFIMFNKNIFKISCCVTALSILAACTTSEQNNEPEKVDPRQGEAVNQICFNRNMDNWSPLEGNRKALIVFDKRDNAFKLDLIGTCDPQWAMLRIATISRGNSSCLSRGDKIITDADMSRHDSCTIMKIHKWHPEKLENKDDKKEKPKDNKTDAKQ